MTGIRLLSTVSAQMLLKASFLSGSVRADRAGKGLLSSVRPAVTLKLPLGGKCLVTVWTLEVFDAAHRLSLATTLFQGPAAAPTTL